MSTLTCTFTIKAKVWLYTGEAAWHFISVPPKETAQIKSSFSAITRGWGSLKVKATIGHTTWLTSIFPDKKTGTFLLPLKSEVRKKEKITADQTITFTIEIQTNL